MTITELPEVDDPRLVRIIRTDYEQLLEKEVLDTTEDIERLILLQSIEGHAHNGHSAFNRLKYVNVDTSDVVRILGLDSKDIKHRRQKLIDEIFIWVNDWMRGVENDRLVNRSGEPLLRIEQLGQYKVKPTDVFRGIYLGGLRDNSEVRKEVEEIWDVEIGGGETYLVDMVVMVEMGLDAEMLACEEHEDDIDHFKKVGLIVDDGAEVDEERIRYKYIRHRTGPGQSDDMAIISSGIMWNRDTALGMFLTDAIDTLEKYSYKYEDQDRDLAKYVEDSFSSLDVTMEDLYTITYICAIEEGMQDKIPDSSLRYLLSVDKKTGITMLRSHINYIEGKPYVPVHTSPCRGSMPEFYNYVVERVHRILDIEFPREEEVIDVLPPASSIIEKNYTIVGINDSINDVAIAMAENEVGFAVVVDEDGDVVGIIQAQDILPYLNIREE